MTCLVQALVVLCAGLLAPAQQNLARQAQAVLTRHCHSCHGRDGSARGGFAFVLDRDRLIARGLVRPGKPADSPLFEKLSEGEMPPPSVKVRPSQPEIVVLRRWIEAGAPAWTDAKAPGSLGSEHILQAISADLESMPARARPYVRYLTLTHLRDAGVPEAELTLAGLALSKLVNSLSWHPRITRLQPVDAEKTVFRLDLRDHRWSARHWERLTAVYPYRSTPQAREKSLARQIGVDIFVLRGDWFVATASRGKLYYELLDSPASDRGLERLLRVDVALNLKEETALRAGFNDSGVSKNNRVIERHDAAHGAYWRSYDFSDNTNRQNIFQFPLGPARGNASFRAAGGEAIYHLPNGLQAYFVMDGNGKRIEKAPVEIVSDPGRPDRQVEVALSCFSCHARGLLPKADQVRGHVLKNPSNFSQDDREAILALYVPARTLNERMTLDNRRYLAALKEIGIDKPEPAPIPAVVRRFEGTLTLTFAAAEAGVPAPVLLHLLEKDAELKKALGTLAAEGGTVQRGVFEELYPRLERLISAWREQASPAGRDAFAGLTAPITAVALDSRGELLLSGDEAGELRLWRLRDSKAGARLFRGHAGSVLALAIAPGGRVFASGGADRQVILWDVQKSEAIRRLVGHVDKVRTLAFSVDGKFLASGGDDRSLLLWNVTGSEKPRVLGRHAGALTALAFSPDGRHLLAADADGTLTVYGVADGKQMASWPAHARGALAVAFAPDGKTLASGGADRRARLWNLAGRELKMLEGHANAIVAVAFSPDGTRLYSGSSRYETPDRVIRTWEVATGKLLASHEVTSKVARIALSPAAGLAAMGGPDRELKTVPLP